MKVLPSIIGVSALLTCSALAEDPEPSSGLEDLLNTTVVTASRYEQEVSAAPASVYIVTSQDIARSGFTTLADILATVPGFYISYDRNYTYIGVRGFGRPTDYNNRILVLVDGHPTNDNYYGSVYAGTEFGLNLSNVERVEIVRGPGSSLYGTGAMFAVINVLSKTGQVLNGLSLASRAGSFGTVGVSSTIGKKLDDGTDVALSGLFGRVDGRDLFFKDFNDPASNFGMASGLDWDKFYGFQGNVSHRGLKLTGWHSSRKKGIPTAPWDVTFNDDAAATRDDRTFVRLSQAVTLSHRMSLDLFASYDRYYYTGTYPYEGSDSYDENRSAWLSVGAQQLWDLSSSSRVIAGASYTNDLTAAFRMWDANTVYADDEYPSENFGIYLQGEHQVSRSVSATIGFRGDSYSRVREGLILAPRVALVYSPTDQTTFKALYGEANRVPNLYELTYNDEIAGYKANPDLKSERIMTSEAVWEQTVSKRARSSVSVYYNRMRNLIDYYVDPVDSLLQYRNIGRVHAYGVEAGFKATVAGNGRLQSSIAYQHSVDQVANRDLSNSPQWLAKAGLSVPITPIGIASLALCYESSRWTVYETKTSDYLLTDLTVVLDPGSKDGMRTSVLQRFRATVGIKNVFDVAYGHPGGYEHREDVITQDGRSVSATLECRL